MAYCLSEVGIRRVNAWAITSDASVLLGPVCGLRGHSWSSELSADEPSDVVVMLASNGDG